MLDKVVRNYNILLVARKGAKFPICILFIHRSDARRLVSFPSLFTSALDSMRTVSHFVGKTTLTRFNPVPRTFWVFEPYAIFAELIPN